MEEVYLFLEIVPFSILSFLVNSEGIKGSSGSAGIPGKHKIHIISATFYYLIGFYPVFCSSKISVNSAHLSLGLPGLPGL